MAQSGLTVDITGAEDVVARLDRFPEHVLEPALVRLVTDAAAIAERTAREGMPKDTSEGARSIATTINGMTATVTSPLIHVTVMDQGRRAGARMPPPEALIEWMRRHGIDANLAYVIARSIARRGIRGRFFYRNAVEKTRSALPNLIQTMLRELEEKF